MTTTETLPELVPDEFSSLVASPSSFHRLAQVAELCSLDRLAEMNVMTRAYTMAKGIEVMRKLLDRDAMNLFMQLMDTGLGFRTDHGPGCKDKNGKQLPPYSESVVKDCLIDAFINGLAGSGNHFNIISGRMYITKEGFSHKIKNVPGVDKVRVNFGIPKYVGQGAVVESRMSWTKDGVEDEVIREFPIKVNQYMGADAVLGKAERKIKAAAYAQMTGSDAVPDGDVDTDAGDLTVTVKPSLQDRLEYQKSSVAGATD